MGVMAIWNKIYRTLASVRTGIILLLITVIFSAVGTVILQRPTTDPEEIARAYTPQTLALLDRFGLTDVYHTWWFLSLLAVVSLSIIFVSIERWPNAWRFYARPYRYPEPHFRATLPVKASIPVKDAAAALDTAERTFKSKGLPVERVVEHDTVSLYSERHRFSVFAVYVVHASLLTIFLGGIVDALIGYRGFLMLNQGQTGNVIELRATGKDGAKKVTIPFSVRATRMGMERYQDGAPKKYWSDLELIDGGKVTVKKTIIVNDPLTYRGVRLFQASMGQSSDLDKVMLKGMNTAGETKNVSLGMNETVQLDSEYSLRLAKFLPEYYVQEDGSVYKKSDDVRNPAFQLVLINKAGVETPMWLLTGDGNVTRVEAPYRFTATDLKMLDFTGLEVAYQPGQWFVWGGVVLMAIGLGIVFYMAHTRIWAVVATDANNNQVLWIGGASNRNRERFADRFNELVEALRTELPAETTEKKSSQPEAEMANA